MARKFLFIIFAVLLSSPIVYANDGDRIENLENEVRDLKQRIIKLEELIQEAGSAKELVPFHHGWKYLKKWRKLADGMTESSVRKILGEPERIDGGKIATWYYENGGRVSFAFGKVQRWSEPSE